MDQPHYLITQKVGNKNRTLKSEFFIKNGRPSWLKFDAPVVIDGVTYPIICLSCVNRFSCITMPRRWKSALTNGTLTHDDANNTCFHFGVSDICRSCTGVDHCYKSSKAKCLAHGGPLIESVTESQSRPATSIKDARELAYAIKTKYRVITWLLKRVHDKDPGLYSSFKLKKRGRSNKFRTITAPDKYLKEIQKRILSNILYQFPQLDCVTAFVPGKNVIQNAAQHMVSTPGSVDIKNFFDTITSPRVYGLFLSMGFNKRIAGVLTALLTHNGIVPQGAPTSPWIANAIFYRGDKKILAAAAKMGFTYTRYADDITYSQTGAFNVDKNFAFTEIVKRIIKEEGFDPNDDKIKVTTNYVTGLSVAGAIPNIPYDKFGLVRQSVHKALWQGIDVEAKFNKMSVGAFKHKIDGTLQWFSQVNPNRPGLAKILSKWELAKQGIKPTQPLTLQAGATP